MQHCTMLQCREKNNTPTIHPHPTPPDISTPHTQKSSIMSYPVEKQTTYTEATYSTRHSTSWRYAKPWFKSSGLQSAFFNIQ